MSLEFMVEALEKCSEQQSCSEVLVTSGRTELSQVPINYMFLGIFYSVLWLESQTTFYRRAEFSPWLNSPKAGLK